MYWILQNNIYSEDGWEKLVGALDRLNIPYSIHKCIPFAGTLDPEPDPPPGPVIVMGSYTLAREAQKRGWVPGVFLNENFNYKPQKENWGSHMFNWDAWVGRFDKVPVQREPFFIRPVEDSKSFTGQVMDWPSFIEWREKVMNIEKGSWTTLPPETKVMVAVVKNIAREYRTWIVDRKVVTASLYKIGSRKHYSSEVEERIIRYAEERAKTWSPARAYVMDIFQTPYIEDAKNNGDLWIGEVNNLNSAGFYAADMQKLVAALDSMKFNSL